MRYLLLILLLCLSGRPAVSATLRVGYYETGAAPYMFSKGAPQAGIYPDVMAAVARHAGVRLDVSYLPPARIQLMFEQGLLDIEVGVSPAWRQTSPVPGVFSIPFGATRDVLCFPPGTPPHGQHADDFVDERVGVIRGFSYPAFDQAFATGIVIRDDNDDELTLLRKLRAGRLQQILINEGVARYRAKVAPQLYACNIGASVEEDINAIRVHPSKAEWVPVFNRIIQMMQQSGELERIYGRYR